MSQPISSHDDPPPSGRVPGTIRPASRPALQPLEPVGGGLPRHLGDYAIIREIGSGAMGVVLLARQIRIGRMVAIKALRADRMSSVDVQRLEREAELLARVRHPGIVAIYDRGRYQGVPYFVMEYIEGRPLSQMIREDGRLSVVPAVRLVRDVARGLQQAHEHGIIHRDLKPGNIIVRANGSPVITDLGLAADQATSLRLTQTGMVVGTPLYMAPEQATGQGPVDARSDVCSLGLILFWTLTGQHAYAAEDVPTVMRNAARGRMKPPSSVDRSIPPEVDAICLTATQADRDRRYRTAADLARALDRALDALGGADEEGGDADDPAAGHRRVSEPSSPIVSFGLSRATLALIVGGIVLGAVLGGFVLAAAMRPPGGSGGGSSAATAVTVSSEAQAAAFERVAEALAALGPAEAAAAPDVERALALAREAIDLDPRSVAAHVIAARALGRAGRFDEAGAAWDAVAELAPAEIVEHLETDLDRESLDPARRRVLAVVADGDDVVAATIARARLGGRAAGVMPAEVIVLPERHATDARAFRERAWWRWRAGEWDAALGDLDRGLAIDPASVPARLMKASWLVQDGQRAPAVTLLAQLIAERPDLAEPFLHRGLIDATELRGKAARRWFEAARARAPNDAGPHLGLVRMAVADLAVYRRRGSSDVRSEEARLRASLNGSVAEAVRVEPGRVESAVSRAWAAVFDGDLAGADDAGREALRRDPRFEACYQIMMQIQQRQGDLEACERTARQWSERCADPDEAFLSLAISSSLLGDIDRGLAALDEIDGSAGEDVRVPLVGAMIRMVGKARTGGIGFVRRDARDARACVELLELARSRDPEYFEGFADRVFDLDGDELLRVTREGARELIEGIRGEIIRELEPATSRALTLVGEKRWAEAEALYLDLIDRKPSHPRPMYELATNLYLNGPPCEALGKSRRDAAEEALVLARRAVDACGESAMEYYLAISLAARAIAELRTDRFEDARRSAAESRASLVRDETHEQLVGQTERILDHIEAQLRQRR